MLSETAFQGASLCVVGNINRDIKTSPFRPGNHLFRDGETSVPTIQETIGGGGANSAFAAAALGAKVAFFAKVGTDELGKRLEQCVIKHGISSRLKQDPAHPTGTSINLTFDNGHRHFISCLPNNESLCLEDLELSALGGYDHLLRADVWFSRQMLFGGNEELFRWARRSGMAVSLDLNWDPRWGVADLEEIQQRKQAIRSVLPWVTLAHGNIRELNEFADSDELEETLKLLQDWGVEAVVVHMGSRGAGYYYKGNLLVEPPAPVQRQINTTGTGDVLSVCLMLLHGCAAPIQEHLCLANAIVAQFIEGQRQFIPKLT
ncbi:MAG: carbohydrate kinase family protein [Acidobacteria bacterium]|nr:carbohydrate kinase family protein [Acidobacteriota bacterium]MCI0722777.1 carbohydrate kinase family protein [Acidobacteriota bacterium]